MGPTETFQFQCPWQIQGADRDAPPVPFLIFITRIRRMEGRNVFSPFTPGSRGGIALARSRSRSGWGEGGYPSLDQMGVPQSGMGYPPLGKVRTGRGPKVMDGVPLFQGWGIPLPPSRDGLPPRIGQQMEYLIRGSMIQLKECGSIIQRLTT